MTRFYHGIDISLDSSRTDYSRKVYAILDLMGNVGGFLGSLSLIGNLIVTFFSGDSFTAFAISRLFERREIPTEDKPLDLE